MNRLILLVICFGSLIAVIQIASNDPTQSMEQAQPNIQPSDNGSGFLTKPEKMTETSTEPSFSESQQTQMAKIKRRYGVERKKLLQRRKLMSAEDYQQHLAAINAKYREHLVRLLGRVSYEQYQQQLHNKRLARVEKLKQHTNQHLHHHNSHDKKASFYQERVESSSR